MEKKYTLIAGGTGGHVFPALSVRAELIQKGAIVDMIVDQRGRKLIHENFEGLMEIPIHRVIKPFGKIFYPLSLLTAFLRCFVHFLMHRPKAVVGFGGYTTLPGLLAARFLCIPIILHEGNSLLGQANRFFQPWAKAIAVSFENTTSVAHKKVIFTGFPLRKELTKPNHEYKLPTDKINILVVGGSQGTGLFSRLVPDAINDLSKEDQAKLVIHQQCRTENESVTKEEYNTLGCEVTLVPFFHNMAEEYAWAHLVISRSGASTLFELAAFKLPSILFPYASSLEGDQARNAHYLGDAAWVFQERTCGPRHLSEVLKELIDNPSILAKKSAEISKVGILDAAEKLADLVLKF